MTVEELIKDIAECFANCDGSVPIKLRHYEWANVVLNLIKEAGWKSPEEWNKNEIKWMNIVQGMREANGTV